MKQETETYEGMLAFDFVPGVDPFLLGDLLPI